MAAGPEPSIETLGLTKRYGDRVAVDELTFSVDPGTVFGFLGPNGAGKSTTMRLLTTLTRPTSGTAWVAGNPIEDRAAVTPHVGYLPEDPPLYEELTAREQLDYAAGIRDLHRETMQERIDTLLERFELAEEADTRISNCSHGMRQKLGIIQAILHDPQVIFLDEPTSGLDPRATRAMRETVRKLAATGTTVFLSTHILPVVEAVADDIGIIHDGRLVAVGGPDELITEHSGAETLEDLFLALTRE